VETTISVKDLTVRRGDSPLNFDVADGLTLLINKRESGTSTLSMALAGRYSPKGGSVLLYGEETKPRQRFKRIALAGSELIDTLERQVDVREVIREQVAWSQMFFVPLRRDILNHPKVEPWLEPLNLTHLDPSVDVGKLGVTDRFRLRILLALIARPEADLLIVDDIDQIRSLKLRDTLLDDLVALSHHLPILATTVNDDTGDHANHIVDLRHEASAEDTETEDTEDTEEIEEVTS